jgi:hypothetical protein
MRVCVSFFNDVLRSQLVVLVTKCMPTEILGAPLDPVYDEECRSEHFFGYQ